MSNSSNQIDTIQSIHSHKISKSLSDVTTIIPHPMMTQMKNIKHLGGGGYGSVQLVRSQLDDRLIALKKIPFQSKLPPWVVFNIDELDEKEKKMYTKLLRELRALAACQNSPHVIKYYASWIEPDYNRIKSKTKTKNNATNDNVKIKLLEEDVSTNTHTIFQDESSTNDTIFQDESSTHNTTFQNDSTNVNDEDNQELELWPYVLNVSMEPVIGMTLYEWIRIKNSKSKATMDIPNFGMIESLIFTQIVMGLKHIHANGVLHRDIKPSNIMITLSAQKENQYNKEILVKLLDFGLAYIEPRDKSKNNKNDDIFNLVDLNDNEPPHNPYKLPLVETNTLDIGTYAYVAPELYEAKNNDYVYGKEVDMYSLGIVLLELCSPFCTEMERYKEIEKVKQTRKVSNDVREFLPNQATLIEKLVSYPNERPSCSQVLDIICEW